MTEKKNIKQEKYGNKAISPSIKTPPPPKTDNKKSSIIKEKK